MSLWLGKMNWDVSVRLMSRVGTLTQADCRLEHAGLKNIHRLAENMSLLVKNPKCENENMVKLELSSRRYSNSHNFVPVRNCKHISFIADHKMRTSKKVSLLELELQPPDLEAISYIFIEGLLL